MDMLLEELYKYPREEPIIMHILLILRQVHIHLHKHQRHCILQLLLRQLIDYIKCLYLVMQIQLIFRVQFTFRY
ncbi:MAG: hypothetical protein EB133_13105 [Betaproteobacteria bacterium]|nr:hypothetical protein [Betaproteobacteria bacterium]